MPRLVGATRSEGGRSPDQRGCFSEGQERIVCVLAKGEAANLRRETETRRAGTAERRRRARELP